MVMGKIGLAVLISLAVFGVMSLGASIAVPGDYIDIQAAIDAATDGDTIVVAVGTYSGFALRDMSNVTISGVSGVVIEGSIVISSSSGCTLEGLQVTVADGDGIIVAGCHSGLTLSGLTITGCEGAGIVIHPAPSTCEGTAGISIVGSTVSNNGGNGITVLGATTIAITGNTIESNGSSGIFLGPDVSGTITENVIRDNEFAAIHPT